MPHPRTLALILVTATIVLVLLPRGNSAPSYYTTTSTTAQQGVPPGEIRYQAFLTDGGGAAINQPGLGFVFTIYDDPILGNALHSESQSLLVLGGLVSASIGPLPELVFQSDFDLWLGVKVGSDTEMVPRLRLLSVPFAIRASSALTADDVPGADITPNSVTVNGVPVIDPSGAWVGGSSGLVGPTGPAGGVGPTGPQGVQGTAGPEGPTGPQGTPGPGGAQGPTGPTGPVGPTGADGLEGDSMPVGVVQMFAGTSAPPKYIICDGSPLSTSTYADLFVVIGYTFGGSGGTFNLPDMRQRFPLGKAASGTGSFLGEAGGSIDHTHSVPAHFHGSGTLSAVSDGSHDHSINHNHAAFTSGGSGTLTTSIEPDHKHNSGTLNGTFNKNQSGNGVTDSFRAGNNDFFPVGVVQITGETGSEGSHDHTIGSHPHNIDVPNFTGSSGTDGAHSHAVNGSAGNTGGSNGDSSMTSGSRNPPYLVLNYIIRAEP